MYGCPETKLICLTDELSPSGVWGPVHITPEEFENATTTVPAILDLCLRKTRAGKSHYDRDVIVFETLRFQNIFRPD